MMELNRREILRYLGYKRKQELTSKVEAELEQMMAEVQQIAQPRYTYRIFQCQGDAGSKMIKVQGTDLALSGKSIYHHLKNAQSVAMLAATLGIEVERQIRKYELTAMSKALILDACCTAYIEQICDLAECEIEEAVAGKYTLNRRFSPGYGDLPMDVQPDLLAVLEADRRLGINLSESMLMMPRKSVSAVIGLFEDEKLARPRRKSSCSDCSMVQDCGFKR